jgi:hypothetical protein
MAIIVASNNIFRRELTSYTLIEAGYVVREVTSLRDLKLLLQQHASTLLIADSSIGQPAEIAQALDQVIVAPLIWIGRYEQNPAPELAAWLDWPYQPNELLDLVTLLSNARMLSTKMTLNEHMLGQNE